MVVFELGVVSFDFKGSTVDPSKSRNVDVSASCGRELYLVGGSFVCVCAW